MIKKSAIPGVPLRAGIIGLGPVGLILAVHLQEAGWEVIICDNDKIKINLIRKEGVFLEHTIRKHSFFSRICTSADELKEAKPDLLIFAVKTYHMGGVLEEFAALKDDKLTVVSAQNGIDTEQLLADAFGEERTLRMVINFAGNLNAPNVVKVTFFTPPNYIASVNNMQTETALLLAEKLNTCGLHTETVNAQQMLGKIWEKTILNSSVSALCGIGRLTIKEAMETTGTVEIVEHVIQEAVEVAEAEKIRFPDDFIRNCIRYLKRAGDHFPSMAVDLINNRETEINYLNGKIAEYGRKHYIRTPLNLAFTSIVRAMMRKNLISQLPSSKTDSWMKSFQADGASRAKKARLLHTADAFLGVDLGSAYTKFCIIDDRENVVFQTALKTLNRDKVAVRHVIDAVNSEFPVRYSCATGYGRKHFADADIIKTEIHCAATGVSRFFPGAKCILDIGGEDIKIIHCDDRNSVSNFYLNDKCAAGTGSFITEVSERAEINISEMSALASKSDFERELNSFCTVFAKTEIMSWLFDGMPAEDIAKGIYISIANRVAKMRIDNTVPVYLTGGVIAHHPYFKNLLEKNVKKETIVVDNPQFVNAYGAALLAKQYYQKTSSARNEYPLSVPENKNI